MDLQAIIIEVEKEKCRVHGCHPKLSVENGKIAISDPCCDEFLNHCCDMIADKGTHQLGDDFADRLGSVFDDWNDI